MNRDLKPEELALLEQEPKKVEFSLPAYKGKVATNANKDVMTRKKTIK